MNRVWRSWQCALVTCQLAWSLPGCDTFAAKPSDSDQVCGFAFPCTPPCLRGDCVASVSPTPPVAFAAGTAAPLPPLPPLGSAGSAGLRAPLAGRSGAGAGTGGAAAGSGASIANDVDAGAGDDAGTL